MQEPDVIRATKRYLSSNGIAGHRVLDLYTDAHPSLIRYQELKPFQRFTLPLDGMNVYPDLVGRLDDGETVFAVEAKGGNGDALQGLMQAASYRAGFHRSLLALPTPPTGEVRTLAQQLHVGLIVVHDDIGVILELPPLHLPRYEQAQAISRQFTATSFLTMGYSLNMPTHYLSVPIALSHASMMVFTDLDNHLRRHYPVLPQGELAAAIRGALKLGLVTRRGEDLGLTVVGEAVTQLLPDLPTLAEIHKSVIARRGMTIDQINPETGAVLRWLLASDPIVSLLLTGLQDLGAGAHSMLSLARSVIARDRSLGVIALFLPEALATIIDTRSNVLWNRITPAHFRGPTRYQYKSIMRQAGLIVPHPLGQSPPSLYDPAQDRWELFNRAPFISNI
jgi:hypothetical protein